MSISQRKKKLAAIKQTEKYLEDQQAKIEIQLEQINEPLNTNFNGKWAVIYRNVFTGPQRISCNFVFSEWSWNDGLFSSNYLLLFSSRKGPNINIFEIFDPNWTRETPWGNLMNNEANKYLRIPIKVILRTGVEMLFNYGFFLLYSDYFFNIMPEQHIWFGYWLLFISSIAPQCLLLN